MAPRTAKPGPGGKHVQSSPHIGYWHTAKRPLQILVFLLPLIVAYEICLALILRLDVEAHRWLQQSFAQLGVAPTGGLFLGGIAIIVVLIVWHLLIKDQWRVDPVVLVLMGVESLFLAVPLLVISHVITNNSAPAAAPVAAQFAQLDIWSKMAISVGAGLYEEMAFRMILIAVVHTLLVDLGKADSRLGAAIAIVVSSAAFTWYHDLADVDGGISGRKVLFYFLAGMYFGGVFILRGFGIVVGVHALYDIAAVVIPASE